MNRRVVVTGIGLVTPLGVGNETTWGGICEGRSGIRPIKSFDASELKTRFGGEVPEFDPAQFIPDLKEVRRSDPFVHFALAATKIALDDSGLEISEELSPRIGAFIGSGIGGLGTFYKNAVIMHEKGPSRVSPLFIPSMISNMAAGYVSIFFNAKGPNLCTSTACASGAHTIGEAMASIQRGHTDAMIAGGTEACVIPVAMAGFNSMRALSTRNDEPERASRPFDRERDGFVISEGAGVVILEELEFAKKRGARIYAEILGFGMSSDAYHITSPSVDGPVISMRTALKDAGLDREDIDYINAHGTSTPLNDANETRAIKEVFNSRAYEIPVSSTKSMTGHLLGAAGGIEAAFTVLGLYHGIIPPTINLDHPDPECDLDYVPYETREVPIKIALTNSFGFGGTNITLAFGRFDG